MIFDDPNSRAWQERGQAAANRLSSLMDYRSWDAFAEQLEGMSHKDIALTCEKQISKLRSHRPHLLKVA